MAEGQTSPRGRGSGDQGLVGWGKGSGSCHRDEIPLEGFEWATGVSDLQMKKVIVTNTWVMDSHGTREKLS